MGIEFAESDRAAGEAYLRLAAGVDEFEGYAHPHAARVARLADALAEQFRLSRADRSVQLLVRWHHEWFGGGGYPDALRGEQIPLGARILRVADAYAALTDARPWRAAGTEAEARKHLGLWAGIEFDPAVVLAFLSLEGLPELRSFARAASAAGEPAPAAERQAPAIIRPRK